MESSIVISVTSAELDDRLSDSSSMVVVAAGSPAIAEESLNDFDVSTSTMRGMLTTTSLGSVADSATLSAETVASLRITVPVSSGCGRKRDADLEAVARAGDLAGRARRVGERLGVDDGHGPGGGVIGDLAEAADVGGTVDSSTMTSAGNVSTTVRFTQSTLMLEQDARKL